jgi:hypothetical protein
MIDVMIIMINNTGNGNNNDDDDRIFRLELNITDLTTE